MDLFGTPHTVPLSPLPITSADRASRHKAKMTAYYEKNKLKPYNTNLSQFAPPETGSVFIGQQIYIKPNYLVSIPEYCYFNRSTGEVLDTKPQFSSEAFKNNEKNLLENDRKGKLSRKAVQGLRNSINWLCTAAKPKRVHVKKTGKSFSFKVNFITLTLPDTLEVVSSSDLQKKLLNPWLTYMRKYQELKNYVWRIEFQANGKLHVHLTTDSFIHLKVVRKQWNSLLIKNGYMKQFAAKHGHSDPNSTDIHATKSINNLAGYLAKYMSKKNSVYKISDKPKGFKLRAPNRKGWYFQRVNFWNSPFNPRPITGRIWSCNYELSQANKCQVHIPSPECSVELAPLMQKEIRYKPLYSVISDKLKAELPAGSLNLLPRKIGEIFFLRPKIWAEKMQGKIKDIFTETLVTVSAIPRHFTIFELE